MRGHAVGFVRWAEAKAGGIAEGERHAGGDALPMEQRVGKAGIGLQRMAEGMAEVEQGTAAGGFALIIGDDRGLGLNAALDRVGARVRIARQQRGGIGVAPGEEGGIVDQAIFDDFGIAGAGFAQGQAVERRGVDEDQGGLVEAADQILAGLRIDRGLAADRRIDLRQQSGGHLDEVAAAFQDRGGKADQIADHAAAQRDDMVAAFDFQREQRVEQLFQMAPALGLFARWQDDRFDRDVGGAQAGVEAGQLGLGHIGVGDDDQAPLARIGGEDGAGAVERALFDQDIIAARTQRDAD